MQNVQAYLKMIISTFKEQPFEAPDVHSPLKPAVNTPNIQVSRGGQPLLH